MSRKVFVLFQAKAHLFITILQPGSSVSLGTVNEWVLFLLWMPRERILLVESHAQHIFREVFLVSVPVKISALTFKDGDT